LVFDDPSGVDANTVAEEGYPPGSGLVRVDPSTPPGDTNDDASFYLDNFTKVVVCKRDSPLIKEPPKQPPAEPVMPWWSRRLAAQSLSRVPASKRGEMLIMQRMSYIKGPSASSASDMEAYDRLFDGNLTALEAEAMDALFSGIGKGLSRRKATS
jgi:hypothetical protein